MRELTASRVEADSSTIGSDRYDRQIRAFGKLGQSRLRGLTVAIVGAGGAGSLAIEGLAHLGVGRLLIIDPDRLGATNLNRVVGATPTDAATERAKVDVAADLVRRIDPTLPVSTFEGSVLDPTVWWALRAADVIVGAVDNDAARWALNVFAVQYARLYLDVGVAITPGPQGIEVAGHVAAVRPGQACLRCLHGYDSAVAARELQPELHDAKRAEGYLTAVDDEPAPSVIFLNQAVVAIAIAEILNWVAPWKPPLTYTLIDLGRTQLSALDADADPNCPVCGPDGQRGLADAGGHPLGASTSTPPPPPPQIVAGTPDEPSERCGTHEEPRRP